MDKIPTSQNNDVPLLDGEVVPSSVVVASSQKKKRKQPKRKHTAKQLALAKLLLNNTENKSLSALMRIAGYSEASIINGARITETPSFIELMGANNIDDTRLVSVLDEGLSSMQQTKSGEVIDYGMRHRYLETALKVKGMTTPKDKPSGNTYNTFIQQNNIDPNSAGAKSIVDNTLDMLMEQTKQQ